MNTITVELINNRAMQLLQYLVALHIIRLHEPVVTPKIKLSEKYRGILSKEDGIDLNKYTDQMRSEWNNI